MTGVYADRMLLRCVLVNESMSTSPLVPRDYNHTEHLSENSLVVWRLG